MCLKLQMRMRGQLVAETKKMSKLYTGVEDVTAYSTFLKILFYFRC